MVVSMLQFVWGFKLTNWSRCDWRRAVQLERSGDAARLRHNVPLAALWLWFRDGISYQSGHSHTGNFLYSVAFKKIVEY
jgi:hypothetical protein